MLLGNLKRLNTSVTLAGFVERSAEHIAQNPELYAEKFQKYGIKDSNGNEIKFTAEELTQNLDKTGDRKKYIKSLRKAITSDTALAKVAIAEATGNLIMDTRMMADSALQGEKIASRADFDYLVEHATQEEIAALTEVFGVKDWGKITVDQFNTKMTELNENGTLKNAAEQMQRVKLAKESETTVPAKALPHRLSPKLSNGVHHYTSENGANIALMKDGDTYHVYDYSTGNISKPMTMQDVNKALKSHYTSAAVETSSDSKIAAAMPLAEATADLSAETKTAADSTEVESAAEEINYLVRDNSPNEFNPEGKSLKMQLEEAFDGSQPKERRYVYVGRFTNEFANELSKFVDIKEYPVVMNYRDAYLSMESKENGKYQGERINYHNLGVEGLESALLSFSNPDYVLLSSKEGKIELVLQGKDYKNRKLISIVEINTKTQHDNRFIDVHVVNSVYGNKGIDNRIETAKQEGRLIYSKKESAQGMPRVQYKRDVNANSLSGDNTITTNSIPDSSEKINSFEKNSSEKVSSYENLKAQNAEIAKFAEENIKDYKKLNDVNRRAVRAVIRQGRAHGLSDADIITIASVSAHSGAKIKFSKADCKRTNKKGETFYVDGFYDGDTDTITVNPEKTRSTDRLLLHELLHDIVMHLGGSRKGFKIYKKLVKQALNNMSEEQQTAIVAKYQEMGETRASVLTEEILAHYGEAFANKSFFEAMLTERQSLGKRILNFFKSAVTDYAGDERLSRSARKFHKAFKKLFDEYSAINQNTNAYDSNLRLSEGENKRFSFGVTQEEINAYVDNAYELKNDKDYKKYATVSDRLMNDVNSEIDISDYSHALRDNDIRHINNSHGEGNPNEKYPVTRDDIKAIPSIVEEYDKVIVYKKSPQKVGLMYVKVSNDGLVYYLEQVTDQYGNEKLLVNKQMIKTGIDDIPDLKGLRDAITKKQSETEFLADLKARQVYAQSVYQSHSDNSISEKTEKINTFSENFAENNSNKRYALSADFDIAKGSISEEATKKAQSTLKELNQNTNAYDSNLRLSEGEKRNAIAVDNYSEEEYNNFGWARENNVLNAAENEDLRSKFAGVTKGLISVPKSKSGEYMIAVGGNGINNKIAFMKGDIDSPIITRILEIDADNETTLSEKRSEIYAFERRGIQQKTGGIFNVYTQTDVGTQHIRQRNSFDANRNNNQLGAKRSSGSGKTQRIKEIVFEENGTERITYSDGSVEIRNSQNDKDNSSNKRYALSADFDIAKGSISEEATKKAQSTLKELNQNTNAYDSNLRLSEGEKRNALAVEDKTKITTDMSEEQRYKALKNRTLDNIPAVTEISQAIKGNVTEISSWEDINAYLGSKKRNIIHKIAVEFGAIGKEYFNKDIQLSFVFSNNNFNETYKKQQSNYESFAKMFSVFDSVVESAVGVEIHNRKNYKTDPTLNNVFVLMSAYQDGDSIVPVKLEVKQFKDKQNTLYVAISLEKIKKTEVLGRGDTENGVTQQPRSVNISIAKIFEKINPVDKNFLKYIPDGFLSEAQKVAKQEALEEDDRKIAENNSNKRNALSADFDIAKGSISEEATKKAQSALKELKSRLKSTPSAIFNSN